MVENDLNSINTLKNIIIILSKNYALASDKYLNVFFEKIKGESDVEQIKELWKDLGLQVQVVIEEITSRVKELINDDAAQQVSSNLKRRVN